MSESSFNRARFAPFSGDPLGSFCDEPTVEFDASALTSMLAHSANEAQEVTRSYEIPAEVLALARGDRAAPAARAAAPARPGSALVVPLAHVLMTAWAIALGYFLVAMIDG
jgi:hypothetical protein